MRHRSWGYRATDRHEHRFLVRRERFATDSLSERRYLRLLRTTRRLPRLDRRALLRRRDSSSSCSRAAWLMPQAYPLQGRTSKSAASIVRCSVVRGETSSSIRPVPRRDQTAVARRYRIWYQLGGEPIVEGSCATPVEPDNVSFDDLCGLLERVGFVLRRTATIESTGTRLGRRSPAHEPSACGGRKGEARVPGAASARGDRSERSRRGAMMVPFRYRIVVEWSDEDNRFLARVPALPGCMAHGRSRGDAAHAARKAAEAILAVMKEDRRTAPVRHGRGLLGSNQDPGSSRPSCPSRGQGVS